MRLITLVSTLLAAQLVAHAAPRKVARKTPVARLKATPLSPQKLRGQIAYIHKGDLWVIHPVTLQKQRIFSGDVTAHIPHRAPGYVYSVNEIESWALSSDLKSVAAAVTASKNNQTPVESERKNPKLDGSQALYSFPLDGGQGRRLTHDSVDDLFDVRWSPNNKHLSYTRHSFYDMDKGVMRGPNFPPSDNVGILYEVRMVDSDGKNPRLVAGTRTSFANNAFWSHDSKRLLCSSGSDDSPLFTIALNGSNRRPFNGQWNDFVRPDVARAAGVRVAKSLYPPSVESGSNAQTRILQLFNIQPEAELGWVQSEEDGFALDGSFAIDARGERVAFGGELHSVSLDSQGFLRSADDGATRGRGIYLQGVAGRYSTVRNPRLIVPDGQLLGWL